MQIDFRSVCVFSAKSLIVTSAERFSAIPLTATSSERFSESRYFLSKEPDNTGVQKDSQRAGIFSVKPLTAQECRKILGVRVFSQQSP
ncbi:MAG: hypothetical protein IJP54_06040 [Synergistaceae bacterium]|nr:hypothetical protein [Synergistaceae bacterium]